MKKRHKGLFVSALLAAIFVVAFGCTFFIYQKQEKNAKAEDLTVVTSFYPMYIAALNVCDGVEGIHLENLSEPQTGCLHDYQLTPEDMKLLQMADVFIVNGGGIENFLTDVAKACPNLTIINASQGLDLIEDNAHAWMSVALHEKQVDNIAEGLAAADADHSKAYAKNAKAYQKKLQALEKQEEEMTQYTKGRSVVLFQEAYEYLTRDLGLEVSYVLDLDEERQVSAGEVSDVMSAIAGDRIRVVFADDVYGKEMGDMVEAETAANTVYVETLVRGDYDKDSYIEHMQENLDAIQMAFAAR